VVGEDVLFEVVVDGHHDVEHGEDAVE
jgi:hypothetical protein